jgi:bifunctional DNase/RNase
MLWILETHFPQNIENIEPRETAQHSYKKDVFTPTSLRLLRVVISDVISGTSYKVKLFLLEQKVPPTSTGGE